MGVYIQNMEMPKDGRQHRSLFCFEPDGTAKAIVEYSESYSERHVKTFQMIEVPEHGRLIDADALIAAHEQVCSWSMKFNLDLAPTIIPADQEKEAEE